MNIILVDVNARLVDAWQAACGDLDGVRIVRGSIFDVPCDAVVSPANSFGFMDGGLDLRISHFFGWHVQERVQQRIREHHHGELLVGAAEIVPTGHARIPFVIAAPTMRVPMILGEETVQVYLATRGVLLLIMHGRFDDGTPIRKAVQTVAIPGMGTGVGQVPYAICARQMRTAIEAVVYEQIPFPSSWPEAQMRHQLLYNDRPCDLQFPD